MNLISANKDLAALGSATPTGSATTPLTVHGRAIGYVEGIFSKKTYVICTDSHDTQLSTTLQAIGKNNIVKQIVKTLLPLKNHIQLIMLMWVPRVSDPMLKSVHFLDYLNFGALFDIFLWSMC